MIRSAILSSCLLALTAVMNPAAADPSVVTHGPGVVNGIAVTLWTWYDSQGMPRTVALKKQGHGNPGHGGYAVQMTYYAFIDGSWQQIIVNAEQPGGVDPDKDGGFGYFVSHERYRLFADNSIDTIASHIFGVDDSPLGRQFTPSVAFVPMPAGSGAESFTIQYGHYGTITADPVDPGTGYDSTPLPLNPSAYAFYPMPVTTTWIFQAGRDYPRIHVAVDLSQIIPPGGSTPTADLVSFDMRGPYGVMVYDNGQDGLIDAALWGDQAYLFTPLADPMTRSTPWDWSAANTGARFNAQIAGNFEMGLFEPRNVANSKLADGYAPERGYTNTSFAEAGGVSNDACASQDVQTLPSDGYWPYQSIQYSLPCPSNDPNYLTDPAYTKKLAWGSSAYYGTSLPEVYNGQSSFPINAFPASNSIGYNVCVVLGYTGGGGSITAAAASAYTPVPEQSDCATTPLP
jgi:hypothetical protein